MSSLQSWHLNSKRDIMCLIPERTLFSIKTRALQQYVRNVTTGPAGSNYGHILLLLLCTFDCLFRNIYTGYAMV